MHTKIRDISLFPFRHGEAILRVQIQKWTALVLTQIPGVDTKNQPPPSKTFKQKI